jgi:hypothetical protein
MKYLVVAILFTCNFVFAQSSESERESINNIVASLPASESIKLMQKYCICWFSPERKKNEDGSEPKFVYDIGDKDSVVEVNYIGGAKLCLNTVVSVNRKRKDLEKYREGKDNLVCSKKEVRNFYKFFKGEQSEDVIVLEDKIAEKFCINTPENKKDKCVKDIIKPFEKSDLISGDVKACENDTRNKKKRSRKLCEDVAVRQFVLNYDFSYFLELEDTYCQTHENKKKDCVQKIAPYFDKDYKLKDCDGFMSDSPNAYALCGHQKLSMQMEKNQIDNLMSCFTKPKAEITSCINLIQTGKGAEGLTFLEKQQITCILPEVKERAVVYRQPVKNKSRDMVTFEEGKPHSLIGKISKKNNKFIFDYIDEKGKEARYNGDSHKISFAIWDDKTKKYKDFTDAKSFGEGCYVGSFEKTESDATPLFDLITFVDDAPCQKIPDKKGCYAIFINDKKEYCYTPDPLNKFEKKRVQTLGYDLKKSNFIVSLFMCKGDVKHKNSRRVTFPTNEPLIGYCQLDRTSRGWEEKCLSDNYTGTENIFIDIKDKIDLNK